jgi:hypothetical protein
MTKAGRTKTIALIVMVLAVITGISTSGLFAGCGKKAPPEPPIGNRPPKVKNLSFSMTGNTIKLSWMVPAVDSKKTPPVRGFLIYRSKQSSLEADCPNCPLRFVEVGDVPVPADATGGAAAPVVFAQTIESGYRYVYKVVAYTDEGLTGKDSNQVDFIY